MESSKKSNDMARPIEWEGEKKEKAIQTILKEISENGKSLRSILDKADRSLLPSNVTFCEWLKDDSELTKQYTRACELRADSIFDEMIDIADETSNDTIQTENGEKANSEWINRSRLRIDTRKWILSKMNPKKYGDKTDITTNGKEINIPLIEWVKSDKE